MRRAPEAGRSPRFSIVVLARDEAHALPRLLRSLGEFIDRGGEVLVLDTGSSDDTIRIAQAGRCRVETALDRFDAPLGASTAAEIERRFAKANEGPLVVEGQRLFHFADARQYAGLLARHDAVFQLDASDELLAFDIERLDGQLAADTAGGFAYDLLNGNVRLRVSRFYDRLQYRWVGRVHETLEAINVRGAAPAPTVRCDTAHLLVRHHKNEGKTRHYLAGLALQVLERPGESRWWHYLGRELLYHRWYRSAIAALETHATMNAAWPAERSQSLCFVAECLENLGCQDEAKVACERAISLDPTRREPYLRLAGLHSRRGEFDASVEWASRSLTVQQTSAYPEPDEHYTWFPSALLYWGLFWLGRRDEARAHWEVCRRLAPDDAAILRHARLFPAQSPPR